MSGDKPTEQGFDREFVRARPGMFVGALSETGLHLLLWELVDYGVREFATGHATLLEVTVHSDGSCTVADDGCGMAVAIHGGADATTVDKIMTTVNRGSKHRQDDQQYGPNPGIGGSGAAVVNFLSAWLEVEMCRDRRHVHRVRFERGRCVHQQVVNGSISCAGTKITFRPDPSLFLAITFNRDRMACRLQELAALHAGLTIILADERAGTRDRFRFDAGLADYVRLLGRGRPAVTDVVPFARDEPSHRLTVRGAMQYTAGPGQTLLAYVNDGNTTRGTHVDGFSAGLHRAVLDWAAAADVPADHPARRGGTPGHGLIAAVSVRMAEALYGRATRDELRNVEVKRLVRDAVAESFSEYLQSNPDRVIALLKAPRPSSGRINVPHSTDP